MSSHMFQIEHSVRFGLEEAILIQNFIFWISKNKACGRHLRQDGRTWTYNSAPSFTRLFPYWTVKQIRRILASLLTQKVLMEGVFNQSGYDHTKWYAFVKESDFLFGENDVPVWEHRRNRKGTTLTVDLTNRKPEDMFEEETKIHTHAMDAVAGCTPELREAWDSYTAMRKEQKNPITTITLKADVKKFCKWGATDATEALINSVENGWTGIFPPRKKAQLASKPSTSVTAAEQRAARRRE